LRRGRRSSTAIDFERVPKATQIGFSLDERQVVRRRWAALLAVPERGHILTEQQWIVSCDARRLGVLHLEQRRHVGATLWIATSETFLAQQNPRIDPGILFVEVSGGIPA